MGLAAYHRCPFDGLPQADEECLLTKAVAKHSVCKRRQDIEDDCHADEDLPGGDVELIDVVGEPSHDAVVGQRKGNCRGDGVVGADVSEDGHLARDFDGTP